MLFCYVPQRQLNQEPISHRTSLALTSHQASPDTTGSSADVEGEEEGDERPSGEATRGRPTGTPVMGSGAMGKAGKGKKRAPDDVEDEGDAGKKRKFVQPVQYQPRPAGN